MYLPIVSNLYNHSLHLHCKYRAQKHASVEAEKKGEVKWNTDFTETEPGLHRCKLLWKRQRIGFSSLQWLGLDTWSLQLLGPGPLSSHVPHAQARTRGALVSSPTPQPLQQVAGTPVHLVAGLSSSLTEADAHTWLPGHVNYLCASQAWFSQVITQWFKPLQLPTPQTQAPVLLWFHSSHWPFGPPYTDKKVPHSGKWKLFFNEKKGQSMLIKCRACTNKSAVQPCVHMWLPPLSPSSLYITLFFLSSLKHVCPFLPSTSHNRFCANSKCSSPAIHNCVLYF